MEYIWQISFPLFSFLFEMNCRLAASNVWHSFSFSLLGLNPNTNLNFTSSALFVNILAVAAKCFPKAHKTQNPKGKYCLATIKFAFYHLWAAARVRSWPSGWAHLALHSSQILKGNGELGAEEGGGWVSHVPRMSPAPAPVVPVPLLSPGLQGQQITITIIIIIIQQLAVGLLRCAG